MKFTLDKPTLPLEDDKKKKRKSVRIALQRRSAKVQRQEACNCKRVSEREKKRAPQPLSHIMHQYKYTQIIYSIPTFVSLYPIGRVGTAGQRAIKLIPCTRRSSNKLVSFARFINYDDSLFFLFFSLFYILFYIHTAHIELMQVQNYDLSQPSLYLSLCPCTTCIYLPISKRTCF